MFDLNRIPSIYKMFLFVNKVSVSLNNRMTEYRDGTLHKADAGPHKSSLSQNIQLVWIFQHTQIGSSL
jgi:hypothetical protein